MKTLLAGLALSLLLVASTRAGDNPYAALPWQFGPTTVQVGTHATLRVPEGYAFLDAEGTRSLNTLMQNPPDAVEKYALAPDDLHWVALFSYADTGYVRDDEKLDADEILASVQQGTAAANQQRATRGWDRLDVLGWRARPEYDGQIKSLAWAILAEDANTHRQIVNYNTRLLGRHGVMGVQLVASPTRVDTAIADFKNLLGGFSFAPGETYAEFRNGDHVAEYGLAALITGGAAAVAAKKGLFTVVGGFLVAAWKFLAAGLAAVAAWLRSLFARRQRS